jgi:hypothetical protein
MSELQLATAPAPKASRANLPAGFNVRDVPTTSARLPWDKASALLAAARNYWMATSYPDGRIHIMPVWGVWLDDALYFTTDTTSQKARNIATNPSVAIHLDSAPELVSLDGTAQLVTDPTIFRRIADAYEAKYDYRVDLSLDNTTERLFVVRPDLAFTWLESDIGGSITRWLFRARL